MLLLCDVMQRGDRSELTLRAAAVNCRVLEDVDATNRAVFDKFREKSPILEQADDRTGIVDGPRAQCSKSG